MIVDFFVSTIIIQVHIKSGCFCFYYSYLKASIGSSFAALFAG